MNSATAKLDAQLADREASRRFRDTLSALQRFLRTGFGGFADPVVRRAVSVFSSRIQAFARMHRMHGEESGEAVDAAAHLGGLCVELCAAQLAPRDRPLAPAMPADLAPARCHA
jgi:two-component sensor histidine kinase